EHDVVEAEQRRVDRGLADEDIEASCGDLLRRERREQRVLVDDAAAAAVDDAQGGLRLGELLRTEQAGGLSGLRDVDGDEVGLLDEFVEGDHPYPQLLCASRRDVGVVDDQFGTETRETLGDQAADATEADD